MFNCLFVCKFNFQCSTYNINITTYNLKITALLSPKIFWRDIGLRKYYEQNKSILQMGL